MTILAACGVQREARIAERSTGVIAIPGGGNATTLEARLHAKILPAKGGEGRPQVGGAAAGGKGEPQVGGAAAGAEGEPQAGWAAAGGEPQPQAQSPSAIISFGLCGALAPRLRVGDIVIGARVTGGFEQLADLGWTATLLARLRPLTDGAGKHGVGAGAVHAGLVFADGTLAASAAAKAALHARTGAIAIDMESHVAARVAAAHRLPFACLRVVSDRATESLPPAFAVAMRPDGGTDYMALVRSLAGRVGQLPRFIAAARAATYALRRLQEAARAAGARLGAPPPRPQHGTEPRARPES